MKGYEIRLMLYSSVEVWRTIRVPENITFKQMHNLIQKLFNFDDYHNSEFQVPEEIENGDSVDLNSIIKTLNPDESENMKINEIFNDFNVLLYVYDFGDNWEIVVYNMEKIDYDYKTVKIVDYGGKYSPMEDIGGIMVFEEIMNEINNPEELEYILDDYGLKKSDLNRMDFEKKYEKGSKLLIS